MIKRLKKRCFDKYPALSNAIHSYKISRQRKLGEFVETPYGFKISGNVEMQQGHFESSGIEFIQRKSNDFSIFIDIGANIGYYTCLALKMGKKTISVEPQSENLQYLFSNLKANQWFDSEIYPLALTDRQGYTTLWGEDTGASLIAGWAGQSERWCETVAVSTLDILIGCRFQNERLFIKIDVEGSELKVLNGATNILEREPSPIWLVEITLGEHCPEGYKPVYENVFRVFWQNGYTAKTLEKNELVTPRDISNWIDNPQKIPECNYFYFKK